MEVFEKETARTVMKSIVGGSLKIHRRIPHCFVVLRQENDAKHNQGGIKVFGAVVYHPTGGLKGALENTDVV